ncbi:HEAT repeat domain-containing protein [Streptomyces sp. GESEQ-35]|uniref:HEAT repeat domain-containing protein n=1 Tax=Streptomyces sp. GESEQ-35 TaxID=2812657 RepID=UPI001B333E5E|nr:HEAT repeat domain-containing protein [Streptomyces sp. GESEQ-35]
MTDSSRFVLKSDYSIRALKRLAWDLDWDVVDLRREEAGAFIDIWITYDKRAEIHHVDDEPIGMRYLTVRGEGRDEVARQIQEHCDLWSHEEARRDLREATDRNQRLVALYAAVLTAPGEQDDDFVDELRVVARDEDPGVRQAVIIATGYLPWPGLVNLVEEVLAHDPVDHIRDNAALLIEGLRGGGQ